jgi:hypothetical protein
METLASRKTASSISSMESGPIGDFKHPRTASNSVGLNRGVGFADEVRSPSFMGDREASGLTEDTGVGLIGMATTYGLDFDLLTHIQLLITVSCRAI